MEPVRVWTKQHAGVAEELARTGVYRAKGRYIALDLEEHAPLVLEVYDWLVAHTPAAPHRPEGAEYPVWVSFLREGTMLPGEGAVILELDPELITRINVAKWGAMLNYAYLPRDEADARRHRKLLSDYGASDARAFMISFYPQIKREILDSWQRLFRHHAALGMGDRSGVGASRSACGASGGSGSRPSGDLPRTSPTARQKSGRQLKYFSGQTYRESPRHWTNSVSCGARAWILYRRAVSVSR